MASSAAIAAWVDALVARGATVEIIDAGPDRGRLRLAPTGRIDDADLAFARANAVGVKEHLQPPPAFRLPGVHVVGAGEAARASSRAARAMALLEYFSPRVAREIREREDWYVV